MTGQKQRDMIAAAIRQDPSLLDPTRFAVQNTDRVYCTLCHRSGIRMWALVGLPDFSRPQWWRQFAPWQYGCLMAHVYRCTCGLSFPAYNNLWRHIGGPRPEGWGRHDGIEHLALDLPEVA